MHILLLNAGSSSLKATVVAAADGKVAASGCVDWATDSAEYSFAEVDGIEKKVKVAWKTHGEAVHPIVADLSNACRSTLAAVGHRVVHGGAFTSSVLITPEIRSRIMALRELAPLHNPPALETIAAAQHALPNLPQIAVFDTAFHASMSPEAYTYAIPDLWTRDWGLRRFGFHGLSYSYCTQRAEAMLAAMGSRASRFVICHLGHGCSAAAIRDGKCVDTTMGFTPLDGLMMATRCGAVDPGIILHVQSRYGLSAPEVEHALNHRSGLLGVSGISEDMRQVLAAAASGNQRAQLAIGIYTHRVQQAIGALAVTIGGIDGLVFTAGVGEHAHGIRASVCRELDCLGLELDSRVNAQCTTDAVVSSSGSRGKILVIKTREDVPMWHEVVTVLDLVNSPN